MRATFSSPRMARSEIYFGRARPIIPIPLILCMRARAAKSPGEQRASGAVAVGRSVFAEGQQNIRPEQRAI